jgi:hypothetical protein
VCDTLTDSLTNSYATGVTQARAAVDRLRAVNPSEKALDTLQQRIAAAEENSGCSCPSCMQAAFSKAHSSDAPPAVKAAAAVAGNMMGEALADAVATAARTSPHYAALLAMQERDEQAAATKAVKKAFKRAIKKTAAASATAAATGAAADADASAKPDTAATAGAAAAAAATERAAYKHQQGAQGGDWQQTAQLRDSLMKLPPGPEREIKFTVYGLDPVQMVSHFYFEYKLSLSN